MLVFYTRWLENRYEIIKLARPTNPANRFNRERCCVKLHNEIEAEKESAMRNAPIVNKIGLAFVPFALLILGRKWFLQAT